MFGGLDTGICTILPKECYPLEGIITIKDGKDNTVTVGEFRLHRGYEEINIKTNTRQVYFAMKTYKSGNLYRSSSAFAGNDYRYELVARTKIVYEDTIITNVQINGVGRFSGDFEINTEGIANIRQVVCKFYPLHKDKNVCDLRVW